MSDEFWASVTEVLWDDVDPQKTFPVVRPLLAHYTSVSSLEKIILTEEIWFSNPLYMNDFEELRFGMNAGATEFRTHQSLVNACETAEKYATLIASFDEFFNDFDANHAMDTYVLCLTEHQSKNRDGLLSMWRGYGANGGGVAVVFDSAKIRVDNESPFIVSKVDYADQSTRLEWIRKKIVSLAEVLSKSAKTNEQLRAAAYAWLERLKLFSLFTKHDGFSEEQEWRVVYMSERDRQKRFASVLGYAVTARGVEPKLKLKLHELRRDGEDPLTLEALVERIILGPSISTVLAAKSIMRMLELNKKASLIPKVMASSIPFRT